MRQTGQSPQFGFSMTCVFSIRLPYPTAETSDSQQAGRSYRSRRALTTSRRVPPASPLRFAERRWRRAAKLRRLPAGPARRATRVPFPPAPDLRTYAGHRRNAAGSGFRPVPSPCTGAAHPADLSRPQPANPRADVLPPRRWLRSIALRWRAPRETAARDRAPAYRPAPSASSSRRRRAPRGGLRRTPRCAIAAATRRTARVASRNIAKTSGCRSSSVSTMSPNGVLCTVVSTACAWPSALLPDGARVLDGDRIALLRHDAARSARSRRRSAGSRIPPYTTAADPARSGRARSAARRLPTRSRAGSRPSRCCRRCCRSVRRSRADRDVSCRSIGNPVPVIAHAPSGLRFVRS